jgi:hypothetical protein
MIRKFKFTTVKKLQTATLIFLFYALFATAAAAQSGNSVMIYSYGQKGTDAEALARYVANQTGKKLFKYPCIDQMDDQSMAALIGWERMRDLLGKELDEETLKGFAGAIGAQYIVSVKSYTLPNGAIYTSVHVIDGKTGKMIAARDMPPTAANNALTAADALVEQLMRDFDNLFKGRCDAHWTGNISYSRRIDWSKTENWEGFSSGAGYKAQISQTKSESLDETAYILLQPMTLGHSGDSTQARVTQSSVYHQESIRNEAGKIPCREPGRNTFLKDVTGDEKETRDKAGSRTEFVPVTVSVRQDGVYRIEVYRIEQIKTKEKFERSGNLMACKPILFSSVSETEGSAGVGYINLEGRIDPKNPDVLIGKLTEGDLAKGLKNWTWNLRLVKPNQKKASK